MSVQSFTPNKVNLSFSDKAQNHVEKELAKRDVLGLRLTVEESGCSGFRYKLAFAEQADDSDLKTVINDKITVFVSQAAQAYVSGIHIDYITEGLNSSFQFTNPNASGTCGCGESFAVK